MMDHHPHLNSMPVAGQWKAAPGKPSPATDLAPEWYPQGCGPAASRVYGSVGPLDPLLRQRRPLRGSGGARNSHPRRHCQRNPGPDGAAADVEEAYRVTRPKQAWYC